MNSEFKCLDSRVQKWVYKQQWKDLRDIQKMAISPILAGDSDVVISASTAAGKTEAAFLPACSVVADRRQGFGILYISPLKALINDQYRRLKSLCDDLEMKLTPWHGDILASKKREAKRNPEGILLITPESLESLLVGKAGWVKESFQALSYIIIDEYHAFIGFERGCHLQSLMHRLESLLERCRRPIPRIALSATLGDMDGVVSYLRLIKSIPCKLIVGKNSQYPLKMQVRGYVEKIPTNQDEFIDQSLDADRKIANDLYKILRGNSHLVFANSRKRTESFAVMLRELCEENHVPNEFFPHHGSLSKELREQLESRLQRENLPTTAVCTMTLELGIDIGKVQSVAQVTAPHSVASLRQRLGRSGRRDSPAILRMYISEKELNSHSNLVDKLRLELLQSLAMIRLLVGKRWYEPADTCLYHFSTLLHQILAVIAQWGGVRPDQLWELLCDAGPFGKITTEHFKILLSHMGEKELITQIHSGELVLGEEGESIVESYTFYAVFKTPKEYSIVAKGRTLGALPIDYPLLLGQHIVFGGRRWKVEEIDNDNKKILVIPTEGGRPPQFGGDGMFVHDQVRQEMYKMYELSDYHIDIGGTNPEFLNEVGRSLFQEGLKYFKEANLGNTRVIQHGRHVYIFPWMGDKVVNTLAVMLNRFGYKADRYAGIIEIENVDLCDIRECLKNIASSPAPSNTTLAESVVEKQTEKYDYLLPESLLNIVYGAKAFDSDKTILWLSKAKGVLSDE